jgi:hypothetical protein
MSKHCKRALSLLAVAAVVALVSAGLALGNKPQPPQPPPPPPPPQLPDVRYRIHFPALPADGYGTYVKHMNNFGFVAGWYTFDNGVENGQKAFIYNPVTDQMVDLNTVVTAGLPAGWRISSAVDINDRLVVVGYIELVGSDPIQTRPFAMDLGMANPVVDLLPVAQGFNTQGAIQINENGDILGFYKNSPGAGSHFWTFNPNLYGAPSNRVRPDGSPLDMSSMIPDAVPIGAYGSNPDHFALNNPVGSRPAQVAGNLISQDVFQYTLGDANPEFFPELYEAYGMNDAGTLSASVFISVKGRWQGYYANCRYNPAWPEPLEVLPQGDGVPSGAINASGDLLFGNGDIYRDDWGGYVNVDDLIVGTGEDLALWSSRLGTISARDMNDRAGQSDSGQICGYIGVSVEGETFFPLFVLTPEPAPEPPQ